MSNLIKKKRYDTHDMSGRFISQVNQNPLLEEKYFQWRKERYSRLAVGRKRDNGWWNDLDSQKKWQEWFNDGKLEIIIVPTPSRSILEKLYNRLAHEADLPIGSAKRGLFAPLAFNIKYSFPFDLIRFNLWDGLVGLRPRSCKD